MSDPSIFPRGASPGFFQLSRTPLRKYCSSMVAHLREVNGNRTKAAYRGAVRLGRAVGHRRSNIELPCPATPADGAPMSLPPPGPFRYTFSPLPPPLAPFLPPPRLLLHLPKEQPQT